MSLRRVPLSSPFFVLMTVLNVAMASAVTPPPASSTRPNVVLVVTDDQGYGDLSCHGNPELQTPHLDALHADSVRLTNFHVDPTCAPTRAALLTGKYSRRAGVWHTVMGRSLLAPEETTLAERFSDAGYRTAIFGKWHLGDNYPLRPQDQGFQDSLVHRGGGIGQSPDFWGNDYFDDVYLQNGHERRFEGYCTDVWFREATRWVETNARQPFLLYLATNAPHAPYNVDQKDHRRYRDAGIPEPRASFYGMIANIDENIGRFRKRLDELGLAENTVFVFMTDNGTAAGHTEGGFDAGMRGMKGSEYEGGHRVPCFIHWPAGGLVGGRDLNTLTAHIDLVPTLCALTGHSIDHGEDLDGIDLSHGLKHPEPLPGGPVQTGDRILVVESQRIDHPERWRKCAVMSQRWRLINGTELYDMDRDPGQTVDVAGQQADVVANLREAYDRWWNRVSDRNHDVVRITIGSPAAPVVSLSSHDWHPQSGDTNDVPWSQRTIEKDPDSNGFWAVQIERPGRYLFRLRRRPATVPSAINATAAAIRLNGPASPLTAETTVDPQATTADLIIDLPAGPVELTTTLTSPDGISRSAYYVDARRLP